MTGRAVVLACAMIGCSSSSPSTGPAGPDGPRGAQGPMGIPNDNGVVAGSRLRPSYVRYTGDDGSSARELVGFFDGALGVLCDFAVAADGRTRCLPGFSSGPALEFSDAACTNAFFISLSLPDSLPRYVRTWPPVCSPTSTRVFAVGAPIDAPKSFYALDVAGDCAHVESPGASIYLAATEVDPSTFVDADEETTP